MKQTIARYFVMLVALCIFGYAAYQLTLIYLDSSESKNINDDISNMFMVEEVETKENGEPETNSEGEKITMSNSSSGAKFVWDFELLLSYNNEAKGYIRQEDGEYIDNPILQHKDNEYYLNHLPNNTYNSSGSIFVDYRIEEGLEAKNPIVYGHRMGGRTNYNIFGSLIWYIRKDGYAEAHPTMDIYIGDKHYVYYVFACYETESEGSDTYQYAFSSDESFMEYVNKCLEKSVHKFPKAGEITPTDKIITLSTCTLDDKSKRTIVQLVQREEVKEDKEETEE